MCCFSRNSSSIAVPCFEEPYTPIKLEARELSLSVSGKRNGPWPCNSHCRKNPYRFERKQKESGELEWAEPHDRHCGQEPRDDEQPPKHHRQSPEAIKKAC